MHLYVAWGELTIANFLVSLGFNLLTSTRRNCEISVLISAQLFLPLSVCVKIYSPLRFLWVNLPTFLFTLITQLCLYLTDLHTPMSGLGPFGRPLMVEYSIDGITDLPTLLKMLLLFPFRR